MADKNAYSTAEVAKALKLVGKNINSIGRLPIFGALVAEFIGAFILTSIFITTIQYGPLYIGFTVVGIVLIIGSISGAHINPAMTIGALVTRKIGALKAIGYILVQMLGAVAAYSAISAFFDGAKPTDLQALITGPGQEVFKAAVLTDVAKGKEWYIFFSEVLGSTILALGIATSLQYKKDRISAAFAQGFAMFTAIMLTMVISMLFAQNISFINPAIAMASGVSFWAKNGIDMLNTSVYILAPIVGAILGFTIQNFLKLHSANAESKN